jgi:RimJ/RimL family protein N-acetyltransferase
VDLGDVSEDREVTVHAEVYDFNPGSGRVLKKVGFEHLTMRKYGIWNDGKLAGRGGVGHRKAWVIKQYWLKF